MSPRTPARASIVTVTYNSAEQVAAFLDSLLLTGSTEHSADGHDAVRADAVTVVENASAQAEETQKIVEAHGAEFLLLEHNLGYGSAMNRGIATRPVSEEYVLISNPDVRLEPDTIAELSAWLDTHPQCAAVAPQILNEDGSVYPSARAVPSLRNGIGHALFSKPWPNNPWSKHYRSDALYDTNPRDAGWLSGACLLVRRDAFDSVGGFDEDFFMYFEDVDLGYRFGLAGWSNTYLPTVRAIHTGGASTRSESDRMLRIHHESAYHFLSKKYSGAFYAPLRGIIRLGLGLRYRLLRPKSPSTRPSPE